MSELPHASHLHRRLFVAIIGPLAGLITGVIVGSSGMLTPGSSGLSVDLSSDTHGMSLAGEVALTLVTIVVAGVLFSAVLTVLRNRRRAQQEQEITHMRMHYGDHLDGVQQSIRDHIRNTHGA